MAEQGEKTIASARDLSARDYLIGGLVTAFLALVFLATPILNIGDHVYAPVDVNNFFPLPRQPGQVGTPLNWLQSDVLINQLPWHLYNRDLLSRGELPLWNPYNAAGVPHLANYQSAVFSPFVLPFYILPLKVALIAEAFLKLFAAGYLMFLFLRGTGIRLAAALVGSVAYMFCGYMIVWFGYGLSATAALIPGCLFCVDRATARMAAQRSAFVYLAGLALIQALDLLSGHPETAYFGILLTAAYSAFRLVGMARQGSLRRAAKAGVVLILAELLAVGMTAIQVVPFLEYLNNGYEQRTSFGISHADAYLPPFAVYPNLLGNPSDSRMLDLNNTLDNYGNYAELNCFYVGAGCLFLAVLGIGFVPHRQNEWRYLFFLAVVLLFAMYAADSFGLRPVFNAVLGLSRASFRRGPPIALISLASGAAFALDGILQRPRGWRVALTVAGIGCAMLVAFALEAVNVVQYAAERVVSRPNLPTLESIVAHGAVVDAHFNQMTVYFGAAVALVALLCLSRKPLLRMILSIAIIGVVFLQGGWLFRNYYPTVPDQYYFAETEAISQVRLASGGGQTMFSQGNLLWPDENMQYRLPTLSNYDALEPRYVTELKIALFGDHPPFHDAAHIDEVGLRLFGVQAIVMDDPQGADQLAKNPVYSIFERQPGYVVLRYVNAIPAYHLVNNVVVAQTDQQSLDLLRAPNFDPSRTAILNDTPGLSRYVTQGDQSSGASAQPAGSVRVTQNDATRIVVELRDHDQAGFLVLASTYYPGWKAKVDENPAPVFRANYALSAVPVPAGATRVEFYYDPDSVKIGAGITLTSLLIGIAFLIWQWRRASRDV